MRAKGIRLVQQAGRYGLEQEGSRAATEVPAEVSPMVAWVLERRAFGDVAEAEENPGLEEEIGDVYAE